VVFNDRVVDVIEVFSLLNLKGSRGPSIRIKG